MQSAETVLGVLRERGRRGLPLKELYRQLFNPQLYLLAYGRIYANKGAMTPGASGETVDGMSIGKIEALWYERYRLSPVKRIHIPKKNGKTTRPLGLPPWSDKLVDEVVRLLLDDFVEKVLIPHCTRERIRRQDTAYARVRAARERAHKARRPRHGAGVAQAVVEHAQRGSPRSRLPAAALRPVLRRHPARVHRTQSRSRDGEAVCHLGAQARPRGAGTREGEVRA
ncbi:hypothetical protein ACWEPL_57530 [Nonomuraea sp. NPDC004186]